MRRTVDLGLVGENWLMYVAKLLYKNTNNTIWKILSISSFDNKGMRKNQAHQHEFRW
jgi:hypothetical protein